MRYLAAALSRTRISADLLTFDPGLDDDNLPPLTRHWPRFATDVPARADVIRADVPSRAVTAPVHRRNSAPRTDP